MQPKNCFKYMHALYNCLYLASEVNLLKTEHLGVRLWRSRIALHKIVALCPNFNESNDASNGLLDHSIAR